MDASASTICEKIKAFRFIQRLLKLIRCSRLSARNYLLAAVLIAREICTEISSGKRKTQDSEPFDMTATLKICQPQLGIFCKRWRLSSSRGAIAQGKLRG